MALGEKRFGKGGSKYITDISNVKVPNWVQKFPLFVSPSKSFDIKTVRDEYKFTLDKWIDQPQNKGKDLNEFRKKHGIIIDEKGRELLTTEWKQARSRRLLEIKQTPQGGVKTRPGYEMKIPVGDKPWWNKVPEGKVIKLEGHHRVGLAHLGPFFDGATAKQAWELRQRILNETDLGSVGTDKRNWEWLEKKQHDLAHKVYGYATDTEVADPKNKGLVFYDMELQGKKGQTSLGQTIFPGSAEFRKKLDAAPFDRPSMEFDIRNKKLGGMRTAKPDPTKINLANLEEAGRYATKGDYLIEYLNMTDEAYKSSIAQARKARPITIPGEATRGKIPNVANPMAEPVLASGSKQTKETINQLINDIRIAEVKKASWGGKKLGATLPVVGAAFAGWGAFDNVKAAAINPTKHNILKAGGSIVETGGELISAGGILAAPATGGVSLGLVPVGEGIALAGSGTDIGATLHKHRKEIKKYASDVFQDKNLPKIRGRSGAKRAISKEQEELYWQSVSSKPWLTR